MTNLAAAEPWIARWPGKSAREPGGVAHPAAYHMLDVAAVAECLLAPTTLTPALRDALVLLVALHDLGKVGEPFRSMLIQGMTQVAGRHWEATELMLQDHDALLAHLGGTEHRRRHPYAATAGHHGQSPNKEREHEQRLRLALGDQAHHDAAELIRAFCEL